MAQTQEAATPKVDLVPINIAPPLALYEFRVAGSTAQIAVSTYCLYMD